MDSYEHQYNYKTGMSHLTGKMKKVKTKALEKKGGWEDRFLKKHTGFLGGSNHKKGISKYEDENGEEHINHKRFRPDA